MSEPSPRPSDRGAPPRQVGSGVAAVLVGAVGTVIFAFVRLSSLDSQAFQDAASRALSDEPAQLGLDVGDVQTIIKVLCFVSAVLAIVGVGLAVEARQRKRRGRLGLTILAPVLVLTGLAVSFVSVVVFAVGVFLLWLEQSRAWFAGDVPAATTSGGSAPTPPPVGERPGVPTGPTSGAPTSGAPTSEGRWMPDYLRPPPPSASAPEQRPSAVLVACVVAWTACAAVGGLAALTLLVVLVDPSGLLDQLRPDIDRAGLSEHEFVVAAALGAGVLVVWSVLAAGFALVAWQRRPWGRIALLVSATVAGLACLGALLSSLVSVVPLVACAYVVRQLLRPDVAAWFRRSG